MKKILVLSSFSVLFAAASCKSPKGKDNSAGPVQAAADEGSISVKPTAKETTEEFRNIFYSYAADKYSKDDIQKLVYLPPSDLLALNGRGENPLERLSTLSDDTTSYRPSQLYDYGKSVPLSELASVDSAFARKGPITIVVVPGIFSEFVESYNFFELIEDSKSSFTTQFKDALADTKDASLKVDSSFDFDNLGQKEVPMDQLIKAASYDDPNGNPLVQVVVLRTLPFSGESIGSLEENSGVFLRRMDKFFKLVGEPENLYIMGYSRGATVGLQMVVDIEARELTWKNKLRGLISLGGVLYGAALADAAENTEDPLQGVAARVKELSEALEVPADDAGTVASLAAATRNSGRWVAAAAEVATKALSIPFDPGLDLEKVSPDYPHLDANLRMVKDVAFKKFDLSDVGISNYFLNIKKFKWMVGRAFEGIETLTTKSRIEWWKTHTIPTRLKYYAISGVMGDASNESSGVWDQTANPVSYNSKALDFLALRISYYQSFRVSKNQLTDSQVSVERSRFLPEVNKILNPNQGEFDSYYMGILGVDHWGMSFPFAAITANQERSPFPRTVLIQSIANFVARHQ